MADVTVKQLADTVGTPVEKLLQQLNDAGVKKSTGEDIIVASEKSQLLTFLRQCHSVGVEKKTAGTSKISLKRKKRGEIKVSSSGKEAVANRNAVHAHLVAQLQAPLVSLVSLLSALAEQKSILATERVDPLVSNKPIQVHRLLTCELSLHQGNRLAVNCNGSRSWQEIDIPEQSLRRTIEGHALRQDIDSIGQCLFKALYANSGFAAAYESFSQISEKQPLTIRLCFPESPEGGHCSMLPWEMLYDKARGRYIGIDLSYRIVRSRIHPVRSAATRTTGKWVVGFGAGTEDPGVGGLNQLEELRTIQDLENDLGLDGQLPLKVVSRLGIDNISDLLNEAFMFHFSGHGKEDEILLKPREATSEGLRGSAIAAALSEPLPHAVILNCCRSGLASNSASLCASLIQRGIAVVVSMSGDLSDRASVDFARHFYIRLLNNHEFESACQYARWFLFSGQLYSDAFLPTVWSNVSESVLPRNALIAEHAVSKKMQSAYEGVNATAIRREAVVLVTSKVGLSNQEFDLSDEEHKRFVQQIASDVVSNSTFDLSEAVNDYLTDKPKLSMLSNRARKDDASMDEVLLGNINLQKMLVELLTPIHVLTDVLIASKKAEHSPSQGKRLEPIVHPRTMEKDKGLRFADSADSFESAVDFVLAELSLDRQLVERCILNLMSGRHLVLVGPPGTGKSSIAKRLASAFEYEIRTATANPDWTTLDVVGGLFPFTQIDSKGNSSIHYDFKPGCFVRAIRSNWKVKNSEVPIWSRTESGERMGCWLLIDEMNRAPLDQAFGDLFTALVEGYLELPSYDIDPTHDGGILPIPADFRLICTANTADQHMLFQLSEALKRRFAFVEIPALSKDWVKPNKDTQVKVVRQVLKRRAIQELKLNHDEVSNKIVKALRTIDPIVARIRAVHPLGMASVLDTVSYIVVAGCYVKSFETVVENAISDQLVPLLENLRPESLRLLASLLEGNEASFLSVEIPSHLEISGRVSKDLVGCLSKIVKLQERTRGWESFVDLGQRMGNEANYERDKWENLIAALPDEKGRFIPFSKKLTHDLIVMANAKTN